VEIATGGEGAVVNAWTAPVPDQSESSPAGEEMVAAVDDVPEADADESADEEATKGEEA
jgi:hypothetical protein